jgi:hypothetical protein
MLSHTRPYLLKGLVEEDFGAFTLTVKELKFLDLPPAGTRVRKTSVR